MLEPFGALAPPGVAGELYIGGAGLARGYLRRAGLTAERFVPNPFSKVGGERLYRTGDLCRYLADGNIEFLGRLDQQVKIRGFRIECGEVEHALRAHEGIEEAVVVGRESRSGQKQLVAYYKGEANGVDAAELRSFLNRSLPEYMIPSFFVRLESFPLMNPCS